MDEITCKAIETIILSWISWRCIVNHLIYLKKRDIQMHFIQCKQSSYILWNRTSLEISIDHMDKSAEHSQKS